MLVMYCEADEPTVTVCNESLYVRHKLFEDCNVKVSLALINFRDLYYLSVTC